MGNVDESLENPAMYFTLNIENFGADPDDVTRLLGIQPTASGRGGDYRVYDDGRRSTTRLAAAMWKLTVATDPHASMSQHIKALMDVTSRSNTFDQLPQGTTLRVFGTIIPGGRNPYHRIPPEMLAEMGRIGAELVLANIRITGGPPTEDKSDSKSGTIEPPYPTE